MKVFPKCRQSAHLHGLYLEADGSSADPLMFMLPSLLRLQFQSATVAQLQPSGEDEQEEDTVAWVNAAVGRIFWDFLSEPHWAELVSKKIQMKLSKIRVSARGLSLSPHRWLSTRGTLSVPLTLINRLLLSLSVALLHE